MSEDNYETKWMFQLLDYENWRIFHLGIEIGFLMINTVDRSVVYKWLPEVDQTYSFDCPRGFMAAYRWARQHEREY